MFTAYLVITVLAIAANAFSGVASLVHFKPILPAMARAGVPESWLTFPISTLKTAGAVGLLLGLIGVPLIGTAAAIGLILFFVCAVYTHLRAGDCSPQFGLAIGFLSLAVATLVLGLAWSSEAAVADAQPPATTRKESTWPSAGPTATPLTRPTSMR